MARAAVVMLCSCWLACASSLSLELDDYVSAVQLVSTVLSYTVDSLEAPDVGLEEELELDKQKSEAEYCSQGAGAEAWHKWTSSKKQHCCVSQGLRCLETQLYMHNCLSATAAVTSSRREWCCNYRGVNCTEAETRQLQLEAWGPRGWPFDCRETLQSWDAWKPEHKRWCCMMDGVKCKLLQGAVAGNMTGGLVAPQSGQTDQRSATPFDCRVGAKAQSEWSQEKKAWCSNCGSGLDRWSDWDPYKKDFCCRSEGLACREAERYIHTCSADLSGYHSWSDEKKMWCCKFKGEECVASNIKRAEWGPRQFPYECRDHDSWQSWTFTRQKWCCKVEGLRCTDVQHLQQGMVPVDVAAQQTALEVPETTEERSEVGQVAAEKHVEQTNAGQTQVSTGERVADKPIEREAGEAAQASTPQGDAAQPKALVGAGAPEEHAQQISTPTPPVLNGVAAEGHAEQIGTPQTDAHPGAEVAKALEEHQSTAGAQKPLEESSVSAPMVDQGAVAPSERAQQSSTPPPELVKDVASSGHTQESAAQQTEKPAEHSGDAVAEKPVEQTSVSLPQVVEGGGASEEHAQQSSTAPPETPKVSEAAERPLEQSGSFQSEVHPGQESIQEPAEHDATAKPTELPSVPLPNPGEGSGAAQERAEQSSTAPLSEAPKVSVDGEGHAQQSSATPAETGTAPQQSSSPTQTSGDVESAGRPAEQTDSPSGAPDGVDAPRAENKPEAGEGATKPDANERVEAGKADSKPMEQSGVDVRRIDEAGKPLGGECWNIGERVQIVPSSEYNAQAHGHCGTVDTQTCNGGGHKQITFDNGYSNWYEYQDLQRCATPP